jgi:hypothetical protein
VQPPIPSNRTTRVNINQRADTRMNNLRIDGNE